MKDAEVTTCCWNGEEEDRSLFFTGREMREEMRTDLGWLE